MLKRFITFEGGEGSGKTTIIEMLEKDLKNTFDLYITREPGGVSISESIREIILDKKNNKMDKRVEALLYAASRVQLLIEKIIPNHNDNKVIICDRYLDSSLAYQGYARGIDLEYILKINSFALDYMPGLTLYIKVEPELALERLRKKKRNMNRLDLESMDFHHRVRDGYDELVEKYPNRIKVIDGNMSVEEVYKACKKYIIEHLNG